jgi:hypothetical protein
MKQEKYISGDERGGFKVAKVNLPFRIQDWDSSFKERKIGWRKDSLCRQGRIKEEKL